MHTLRYIMGDDLFFPTLKKLATDPLYTYDNTVVTSDVEKLFSKSFGKNLEPLFHLMLYTTNKLEFGVRQTAENKFQVKLLNLEMALPLEIMTDTGIQKVVIDKKGISITSSSYIQIDPKGFYLKKIMME